MKLLLDTHVFLWSYSEPDRLPSRVADAIADPVNEIFISSVSFWEIGIKIRIGKLEPIGRHPRSLIDVAEALGMRPIALLPEEAAAYSELKENTHNDPFDRMLISQAISRKLTLVSGDAEFARFKEHGLDLFWK